jgi:hypothetical protein
MVDVKKSAIDELFAMALDEYKHSLRDRDKDYWEGFLDCLDELGKHRDT